MIHATAKRSVFSTFPTFPSARVRRRTHNIVGPTSFPLPIAPKAKDSRWREDVYNIVLLCLVAGVVLAAPVWMARSVIDQMMQVSSIDLLRIIRGGM